MEGESVDDAIDLRVVKGPRVRHLHETSWDRFGFRHSRDNGKRLCDAVCTVRLKECSYLMRRCTIPTLFEGVIGKTMPECLGDGVHAA